MILQYIKNVAIAVDQLFNAFLGGDPDETISGRSGKFLSLPHSTLRWKLSYALCRVLHIFDKNHCIESIELDEGKDDLIK